MVKVKISHLHNELVIAIKELNKLLASKQLLVKKITTLNHSNEIDKSSVQIKEEQTKLANLIDDINSQDNLIRTLQRRISKFGVQ
jgi:predicted DNA-binding ArsR family transcriptional regulator